MKKIIIILFIPFIYSCSTTKFTFRKPQKLPFEILNSIKEKKDWENKILKGLFKKYEIEEINEHIVLEKEFKQYDKNYKKRVYNNVWVRIKTSNEYDLMFFSYDLKRNFNNNSYIKETLEKYEEKTSIQFLYYHIPDKLLFDERIMSILGKPNEITEREMIWNINGYRIVFLKDWRKIKIQLKQR